MRVLGGLSAYTYVCMNEMKTNENGGVGKGGGEGGGGWGRGGQGKALETIENGRAEPKKTEQ